MRKKSLVKNSPAGIAITVLLQICLLVFVHSVSAQTGGEFELLWSGVGIAGESSGGAFSHEGSFQLTDANELSGGVFAVKEESVTLTNCIVDFTQFVLFADHWLERSCDAVNDFCSGADLYEDEDNIVNRFDLGVFVDEWLYYCPPGWTLK